MSPFPFLHPPSCIQVGPLYVDAMVLRDRDTDSDGQVDDERLYTLHDANYNVTALVNAAGTVVERYRYDPYGAVTVLDTNWATDADGQSDVGWVHLHQGGRYDTFTGLYHFRNRDYSPELGRWTRQDPAGYVDGANLYQYVASRPTAGRDPWGLQTVGSPGGGGGFLGPGTVCYGNGGCATRLPPFSPPPPLGITLKMDTARLEEGGRWKNRRRLTPEELQRLRVYGCVMEKAGLISDMERASLLRLTLYPPGYFAIADPIVDPTSKDEPPLGETNPYWSEGPNITFSSKIFNDPLFGPQTFFHEYLHFINTNGGIFGALRNAWWNVVEKCGGEWPEPTRRGDAIMKGLADLPLQQLKQLYKDCEKEVRIWES